MVSTELAPRWLQFHVAPAMPRCKYTTSVDIQKTRYKKLVPVNVQENNSWRVDALLSPQAISTVTKPVADSEHAIFFQKC